MLIFLRILSILFGICAIVVIALTLSGCSAAPLEKSPEAVRNEAAYAVGAQSFVATQERVALYTREEAERREARRKYDEEAFWRKQKFAGK